MAIDNIQEELSLVPRHNKKGTGVINWTNDEKIVGSVSKNSVKAFTCSSYLMGNSAR